MKGNAIILRLAIAAAVVLGLGAQSHAQGASFYVVPQDPGTPGTQNLVGNPSFETDTSGWKPYPDSTTLIERVAGVLDGAFALEVRGPATTPPPQFGINDGPDWVGTTPAVRTRYRITAWVRSAASTGQARIRVREFPGIPGTPSTNSPTVQLTPTWQLVAVDYVTQAVGSHLDVQVLDSPAAPGEVFQVDNIVIAIDNSSGTIDDPLKTINYALTKLRAGDTLFLRGGTYYERVSAAVSGAAGSPIVVQSHPGETAVLDSGPPEFRTAGNSDWVLVDATIGEYKSVKPYPSGTVYGYILGIPGYENERVGLVPYASAAAFRATTDVYEDESTPFYVGPGTFWDPATNLIHIRLQKTAAMRATEQRYGTVFPTDTPDPREYAIVLSVAPSTLTVSGAYVTFKDLTLNQAKTTIVLTANANHLRFDSITAWTGNRTIDVIGTGVHDITLTRSRIYGDTPYWIFWSDTKNPPKPADELGGTSINLAKGTHDWEIAYNHIRGGQDGIGTNTAEYNIFIHHNRIENFLDDALELEGTENVGKIAVFENYIGNSLVAVAPGQATPRFDGPLFVYRNVMALLRNPPVNRKEGINTWNGGLRYGFEYMLKQHSPNTHYYHNTLVLLNSAGRGLNLIPAFPAGTYVANNIAIMVNGVVNGEEYRTGPGQLVDGDLYWKVNTVDAAPLLATSDTVAAFRLATGLEPHGIGETPKRGTDPLFATFRLAVVDPAQSTWELLPSSEVFKPSDFLLGGGSPAIGAGVLLPRHPTLGGHLPDSRTSLDIGALPASALAAEYDIFPFIPNGPVIPGDPPNGVIDTPTANLTILAGESVSFSGTGSDPDGNLPLTFHWTFGDGQAHSLVEDPGVVTFSAPGTYTVTFTVTDSSGLSDPTPDRRVIMVNPTHQAPTVNAGGDRTISWPTATVTLSGVATDDGLPDPPGALTVGWTQTGGPPGVVFSDPTRLDTTATFAGPGRYILTLTASDGELTATDDLIVTVLRTLSVPGDSDTIQGAIALANDGDLVLVAPGFYPENLVVAKAIILASHHYTTGDPSYIGQTVIDGGRAPNLPVVRVPDRVGPASTIATTIVGFTIQQGATDGVAIGRAKFNLLSNRITRNDDGVNLNNSDGVLRGNILEANRDDGLDLDNSSAALIEDNSIRNNGEGSGNDGIEIRLHNYSGPPLAITIRNNTITGNREDGIQLIDNGDVSARVFIIERNLIQGNGMAGLGMMRLDVTVEDLLGEPIPDPIFLTNNTFVGNNHAVSGGANVTARNNIFVGSVKGLKNVTGTSRVTHSLFWNNGVDADASNVDPATTLVQDPLLDAAYHLLPGSPAIDAGVDVGLPFHGPAPDLGAYETVSANQAPNGTIDSPATHVTITAGQSVSFSGTGSDPDNHQPLAFLWDFGGGAPNATVEDPGPVTFSTLGTYTVTFIVQNSLGGADPTPDRRVITVNASQPPNGVIDTPTTDLTIETGESVNFTGTGSDPDGNLPLSYLWDFGGGAANQIAEDPGLVVFSTPGSYTVRFVVTDSSGSSDPTPDSRVITVNSGNLVANPSFEGDTSGWNAYGGATIQRVAGGVAGVFALEMRGPASRAAFGINDRPNWVATSGAAGTRYRFSAWVRAEASTGQTRIRVREYGAGVLVGTASHSAHVTLTRDWQMLTVDFTTGAAGSTLDFQVLNDPVAPGEVFQVDNISIRVVP